MGKRVRVSVVSGPLAAFAAGYESWLSSRLLFGRRRWLTGCGSSVSSAGGLSPSGSAQAS